MDGSRRPVRIDLDGLLGNPDGIPSGRDDFGDLMYRKSGPGMRRFLDILTLLTSLCLMGVILFWGYDYAWRTRFQTIPGIESLTMLWAYIAMPVGACFSVIAILGQWLDPRHYELDTAQ